MPNITLSIPEELYKNLKKYKEISWSEVARQAIEKYINRLELLEKIELDNKLKLLNDMLQFSELTEDDITEIDENVKKNLYKKLSGKVK